MRIVMVAAENGAIPGGKVGGMGDVIRDVPNALAKLGHRVEVVVPGYQAFSTLPGTARQGTINLRFGGAELNATLYLLALPQCHHNVRCWVIDHPDLAPANPGDIYCNDPAGLPFATDASKFALFCAAVCQCLADDAFGPSDVVHLHDWHMALVAVLARYDRRFAVVGKKRLVFTIHNLALQGIRPLTGHASSLENWFPGLAYDPNEIADPRYIGCFNPMRAGINLCQRIHTVSPNYAREIQRPSDGDTGFFGGEGLERDLQRAHQDNRLVGILNGCDYSPGMHGAPAGFDELLTMIEKQVMRWIGAEAAVTSHHFIALQRIAALKMADTRPGTLLTSVGRLTDQKVLLLRESMANGKSGLENILAALGESDLLVMLGSGDPQLEQFFARMAGSHDNFLFLRGYAEGVSEQLYQQGDLFLMPSSFEPGGISQMLAMRAGQPCIVHGVGGLADTVVHNRDGFVFDGQGLLQQGERMVDTLKAALALKQSSPKGWAAIAKRAAAKRFLWRDTAKKYCAELYGC